jgi:beta-fructofuranosidase
MRALGTVAWLPWLLLLQLAGASHVVHDNLLEVEAAAAVPASIVDPELRTGYHFQPPKNWINGNVKRTEPGLSSY